MDTRHRQMLLDLKPEQPPTLDNFVVGDNKELMARLKAQGKSETVLRMHQGKLKRREEELQVRMQELAKTPRFDVEEHEVCSLLLLNEVGVVES